MPVALNLDALPGADGIVLKLYADHPDHAKPVAIKEGQLDLLLYDGLLDQTTPTNQAPLHVWSFTAKQLAKHASNTTIGTGYDFALPWGDNVPQQNYVTVVGRFTPRSGPVILSAPTVITVVKP